VACEHTFVSNIRNKVEELLAHGVPKSEIARRLGVAGPTVDYHASRLAAAGPRRPSAKPDIPDARQKIITRESVQALLAEGLSRAEIARQLGLSKSTVSYHARRTGASVDARFARRYDWSAIQRFYDAGYSMRECRLKFGFSSESWHKAVKRGAIVARPAAMPAEQFFAEGVYRSRHHLKLRLIREGHKDSCCARCGLDQWQGEPLALALHHINGDRDDNRIANLELLCPNCHSQTDNFSGRNGHRRPAAIGDGAA
jgi:DNA-binding CsgD family transcriptional regulator/5-methylcytosine-specific restriction endonuclease McrA